MKRTIYVLSIIFLVIMLLSSNIYATDSIISIGEAWTNIGGSGTTNTTLLQTANKKLFNLLFDIGIGVIVIVGAFLGIKFMTAGVEEKAEVKETLMPYFISSIILVGAYGIWKLAVVILRDLV